jgi:predicted enzyme related to lactoylglutathione lyase
MPISRTHLLVYVHDPATAAAFYRHVLAKEPTLDVPGMTEFELSPGAVLGLMPERGIVRLLGPRAEPASPEGGVRAELYLVVDDPAAYHARALHAGAEELSPLSPRDWGDEVAYSRDRDGTVLAFARPYPARPSGLGESRMGA